MREWYLPGGGHSLHKSIRSQFRHCWTYSAQVPKAVTEWPDSDLAYNLFNKWFTRLVKERFANMLKKSQDPNIDYTPPQDLITCASDALLRTGNSKRCSADDLSSHLALIESRTISRKKTISIPWSRSLRPIIRQRSWRSFTKRSSHSEIILRFPGSRYLS